MKVQADYKVVTSGVQNVLFQLCPTLVSSSEVGPPPLCRWISIMLAAWQLGRCLRSEMRIGGSACLTNNQTKRHRHAQVDLQGEIGFKNPYGYLPGRFYGYLPFEVRGEGRGEEEKERCGFYLGTITRSSDDCHMTPRLLSSQSSPHAQGARFFAFLFFDLAFLVAFIKNRRDLLNLHWAILLVSGCAGGGREGGTRTVWTFSKGSTAASPARSSCMVLGVVVVMLLLLLLLSLLLGPERPRV